MTLKECLKALKIINDNCYTDNVEFIRGYDCALRSVARMMGIKTKESKTTKKVKV